MKTTRIILILLTCAELSFGQPNTLIVPDTEFIYKKCIEDVGLNALGMHSDKHTDQIDIVPTQEKKWSLSLFGGFSFISTGDDIKHHMRESGFGYNRPGYEGWLGYVEQKDYPILKPGMIWNFETRYNVSKKSALNITGGNINHSSVEGYNYSGNYLRIKSDLRTASLNYVWRTGKGNDGLSLGPVIARHIISVDSPYSFQVQSSTSSTTKAGFNLGYNVSFVQKKNWFMTFKANYTWLPDIEIGSYTSESQGNISVFKKTHARLSTLNVGIATGWRW